MKVRWLLRAAVDLERLHECIAKESPQTADREAEKLVHAVKRLGQYPASGRPGRVPGTRELVVSSYVVAYRVKGDVVQVLRVLHAARAWPDEAQQGVL